MLPNFALVEAIKRGSEQEFEEAIARGASVHAKDFDGSPALLIAAKRHQNDLAEKLIEQGADFASPIDAKGNAYLNFACSTGNFGFARLLLERKANPNATNQLGQCPLHLAVNKGHEYLACELIKNGALLDAVDRLGDAPLHIAARRGDIAIMKRLRDAGCTLGMKNQKGYSPLLEAAKYGHTKCVQMLIDWGCPVIGPSPRCPASKVAERYGNFEAAEMSFAT